MDRRPIYQARGRCKQQDPAKQLLPQGMRVPSGGHGSHSETAAILLVIDLVHIPLHQAVELLHGIFDKWQRARQDWIASSALVRSSALGWVVLLISWVISAVLNFSDSFSAPHAQCCWAVLTSTLWLAAATQSFM